MQYTDINGFNISKITLGTAQLGMDYGIANKNGKPSFPEAMTLLDEAICGGVNSFDTAAHYGESENILGKYLANKNSGLFITTKFILDEKNGISDDEIFMQTEKYLKQSLKSLGVPKISLYMMHRASDMIKYGKRAADALVMLKERNLAEYIGVSVYNAFEIDKMLELGVFDAVQLPMGIMDQRLIRRDYIRRLNAAGVLIFVRSVFTQGLIFLDHMPPGMEKAAKYVGKIRETAKKYNRSVGELALKFISGMQGVASLVLGAETAAQIKEIFTFFNAEPLSGACIDELLDLGAEIPIDDIMDELLRR